MDHTASETSLSRDRLVNSDLKSTAEISQGTYYLSSPVSESQSSFIGHSPDHDLENSFSPIAKINVRYGSREPIALTYEPQSTLRDVKERLLAILGLSVDEQRLLFNNKLIGSSDSNPDSDGQSLAQCGIHDGATLSLIVLRKNIKGVKPVAPPVPLQIHVILPDGRSQKLSVKRDENVGDVKTKALEMTASQIPASNARFFLQGEDSELADDHTLADYKIKKDHILRLEVCQDLEDPESRDHSSSSNERARPSFITPLAVSELRNRRRKVPPSVLVGQTQNEASSSSSRTPSISDSLASSETRYGKIWPTEHWVKGTSDRRAKDHDIVPTDWTLYIHPDGKHYYTHQYPSGLTLVTDDDILKPGLNLLSLGKELQKRISMLDMHEVELYLTAELRSDLSPASSTASYYFVHRKWAQAFWIAEDVNTSETTTACGETLEQYLYRNYLSHLQQFPCHDPDSEALGKYLRASLVYAATAPLFASDREKPFRADECSALLGCLAQFESDHAMPDPTKANVNNSHISRYDYAGYKIWFLASALQKLCAHDCTELSQFTSTSPQSLISEFSIERAADLDPAPPISPQEARSYQDEITPELGYTLNLLSGFIYFRYRQRLHAIRSECDITSTEYKDFINSLVVEWSHSNLLATIILVANTVFLTRHSFGDGSTFSIISTLFAAASIAMGLHNVTKHNTIPAHRNNLSREDIFSSDLSKYKDWLPAFLLGLPLVLLLWSLVSAITLFFLSSKWPIMSYVFRILFWAAVAWTVSSRYAGRTQVDTAAL